MGEKVNTTKVQFPVSLIDKDGYTLNVGDVHVSVAGPQQVTGVLLPGATSPLISFETQTTGSYTVSLYDKNNNDLQHSPITVNVTVKKDEQEEKSRQIEPPKAQVQTVKFEVEAKDQNGNVISSNDFQIEASGPQHVEPKVTRLSQDKLLVSFETMILSGVYTISIKHQGQNIRRSPFEIRLTRKEDANVNQREEVAKLPPLPPTRLIQFEVPSKLKGTQVSSDGFSVIVIDGPDQPKVTKVEDAGNGNIRVMFEIGKPGKYEVAVRKGGDELDGSPFDLEVPEDAFK